MCCPTRDGAPARPSISMIEISVETALCSLVEIFFRCVAHGGQRPRPTSDIFHSSAHHPDNLLRNHVPAVSRFLRLCQAETTYRFGVLVRSRVPGHLLQFAPSFLTVAAIAQESPFSARRRAVLSARPPHRSPGARSKFPPRPRACGAELRLSRGFYGMDLAAIVEASGTGRDRGRTVNQKVGQLNPEAGASQSVSIINNISLICCLHSQHRSCKCVLV